MATFEEIKTNFKTQLIQIASRIPNYRGKLGTEESTKNSLIMPLIRALGYDVFNPDEVNPEYTADFATKTKEKVDYAIMKEGKPIMLVECKQMDVKLGDNHAGQLFRYFSVSEAKIGILTNGVEYRFFSDMKEDNKMDNVSFWTINLEKLKEDDYEFLAKFHKDVFDLENIVSKGQVFKDLKQLKEVILKEMKVPSDEFVASLVKQIYDGKMTAKAYDRYRPIVVEALNQVINEKLTSQIQKVQTSINEDGKGLSTEESKIVTTEEEKMGFMIVRAIASKYCSMDRISLRDKQYLCNVLFDDNIRKPIIKMYFNDENKYITIKKDETKLPIKEVNDIYKYQDQIVKTINEYLNEKEIQNPQQPQNINGNNQS